jgi:uncharacterized membrane protein YfcA
MDLTGWLILMGAALGTAALSGVLGMGGGVTLLGVMTALLPAHLVVPLHGVAQLVSNFTRTLTLLRHVAWKLFAIYAPPLLIGTALAAWTWSDARLSWFRPGIGVFLLAFLIWRRYAPKLRNPPLWVYGVLGLVVGFSGVWIGATGPLIAPFFLRDDFEKEQVIATKAVCQSLMHLLKVPAFLAIGFDYRPHLPFLFELIIAVIVGTLLGRAILAKLPKKTFLMLFEGLLAILAAWLIASSLR